MKSVNKVVLIGNVTREPELTSTANGHSLCLFGLATNRVWKDRNGDKQSLAEFHNLAAWDKLGEFCGQHIKKGKPLYIEGHLQTRSWDAADGKKNFRTEIVADEIVLLNSFAPVE
jgi:single-strand DNA-binding protein